MKVGNLLPLIWACAMRYLGSWTVLTGASLAAVAVIGVLLWTGDGSDAGQSPVRDGEGGAQPALAGIEVPDAVSVLADEPLMTVYNDTVAVCAECVVHLEPVGRFGQMTDSILLRGIPRVERDSRGRFYATVLYERDH